MKDKSLLLIGVDPFSLINFRGNLIKEFVKRYDKVYVVSLPATTTILKQIDKIGAIHYPINIKRNNISPWSDIILLIKMFRLIKQLNPDIVMSYTIKPIIFSGLVSRFYNKKFVALITGLGFTFQGKTIKRKLLTIIVTNLYRQALKRAAIVFFQNSDNKELFLQKNIITKHKTKIIAGSGVDTTHYKYHPLPDINKPLVFLCIARLLGEKGLREYAAAAQQIRQQYPNIIFQLLGDFDTSPDGIKKTEVMQWQKCGLQYLGTTDNVREIINACHIFVLPSYHEGIPRSTLEAMSIGRAILTTNAVGCKETVIDGKNGFKVAIGSVDELVQKMLWFIKNPDKLQQMGEQGRELVIEKFEVSKINGVMTKYINDIF